MYVSKNFLTWLEGIILDALIAVCICTLAFHDHWTPNGGANIAILIVASFVALLSGGIYLTEGDK